MKLNPGPFVVFFVFLGLRLSETTDWSWVWVTSPLWIGAGITLVAACFAARKASHLPR
jgi:NhaP-type Na+/H+ or K+/H+ antiporter